MTAPAVTDTETQVASYIGDFTEEHGYPPAIRQICEHMGWTSPSTAHDVLERMLRKGIITREPGKSRTLRVVVA